jgi:methylamine--corrinoid protein Co-methyltransferase
LIKFAESELREEIKNARSRVIVGEGKDTALLSSRQIEDTKPPFITGGGVGILISEDAYVSFVMSYAKEKIIEAVCVGMPETVDGIRPKPGTPLEIYYTRKEVAMIREGFARAGRPGLEMLGPGSTTATSWLSSKGEGGHRKSDAHTSTILNELKTSYDILNRMTYASEIGGVKVTLSGPVIGGFAGGPEGVAVTAVAGLLLGVPVFQSDYQIIHPTHLLYPSTTSPESIWAESVVGQAISRNSHLPVTGNIFTASGPCTEMILYETAANAIGASVSGLNLGPGVGATNTKYLDHASGLESRFMGEVGHAVARSGLKREDANTMAKKIIAKYKTHLTDAPRGKRFQECYQLPETVPTKEWREIYNSVKKELSDLGLEFAS